MIYSIESQDLPSRDEIIDETIWKDKNNQPWAVWITGEFFYLKYIGRKTFEEVYFDIRLPSHYQKNPNPIDDRYEVIENTSNFKIPATFKRYCDVRDWVLNHYTDDVWDMIQTGIQYRISKEGILPCERKVKTHKQGK